jgi:hypothetical protein
MMPVTSRVAIPNRSNAGGRVRPNFSSATDPTLIDLPKVQHRLAELVEQGRITDRDEQLLEYLAELKVLSLEQVRRLLWPQAKEATAYNRLYFLSRQQLLRRLRLPPNNMKAWGLPARVLYTLGLGGRLWLGQAVDAGPAGRHLPRAQALTSLLSAEIYVRLVEAVRARGEAWGVTWAGTEAASYYASDEDECPLVAPDSLVLVHRQQGDEAAVLPFFVELDQARQPDSRLSSNWGWKARSYDRLAGSDWQAHPMLGSLASFPPVAVITHCAERLLDLAETIDQHRRAAVTYYLAVWSDLIDSREDILAAPAWLAIAAEDQDSDRKQARREPLLTVAGWQQ